MSGIEIIRLTDLDLRFEPQAWEFAEDNRADIASYFETLQHANPSLWNGRVLMLGDFDIEHGSFRGECFETDFASFLAWRDWDFPDGTVKNIFGMGALQSGESAFILGVMGPHTANAGKIQFASGTPDLDDIRDDGTVDLLASVLREVAEETGLTERDFAVAPGWSAAFDGGRIALMKDLTAQANAGQLQERIRDHFASESEPELTDVRIVRGPADLKGDIWPFVRAYLEHVWNAY